MSGSDMAITMVYPIMKAVAHKGLDPEVFCRYASFDAALLHNADARIDSEELVRLMTAAAEYTQDEHFGMYQGQVTELADLGMLGSVLLHSATIADALSAYERYHTIVCSGFNISWHTAGGELVLRLFAEEPGALSRHCAEDMAVSLYRIMSGLSLRRVTVRGVQFAHAAPADVRPYMAAFGVLPTFEQQEHVLRIPKEVLEYPVVYADARLRSLFESLARETLEKLIGADTFSGQVVTWIRACMPRFFPTLLQTAEHFGVSTRTVQHKLKEEHTSYQELSVQVRKELAMGYLRRREYSIGDVAYVLHFSEPSAFQLAFKRWTGLTPGQYRLQEQQ
ncbi:AraC family transcriptional regulator [Paenibacillus sp. YYML68]|uniref:AraC family transcriptional regulator n=1 Tax=Paenibacillus sp. YYML68 TaxID=2909250 RepID=UPI00248FCC08|nr:AraC family transcriptional regulator [Paenibacillus sp. YYML68]